MCVGGIPASLEERVDNCHVTRPRPLTLRDEAFPGIEVVQGATRNREINLRYWRVNMFNKSPILKTFEGTSPHLGKFLHVDLYRCGDGGWRKVEEEKYAHTYIGYWALNKSMTISHGSMCIAYIVIVFQPTVRQGSNCTLHWTLDWTFSSNILTAFNKFNCQISLVIGGLLPW